LSAHSIIKTKHTQWADIFWYKKLDYLTGIITLFCVHYYVSKNADIASFYAFDGLLSRQCNIPLKKQQIFFAA
jgi:hypothetical protein